ncbi:ComEC/Rec2 family competence protein [Cellulosimicrobium sp. PMB13]|uniref:ComEC/Rec2 family competence protein n=1 Tax=Cellulosimicrobium sp. PMB13 TaxID=3120158 RepID=UPI003F4B8EEF
MTDLRLAPAALAAWTAAAVGVGGAPAAVLVAAAVGAAALGLVCLALVGRAVGPRRTTAVAATAVPATALPATAAPATAAPATAAPATVPGRRGGLVGQAVLVLACVTAVLLSCGAQLVERAGSGLTDLAQDGATARVTATVRSAVVPRANPWTGEEDRREVRVEAVRLTARGVTTPASGQLVVAGAGGSWDGLAYGATVEAVGTLSVDGDRTFLRVDEAPRVLEPAPPPLRAVHSMRQGLLDATAGLSPQARGLVPGVAVGDTSRLDPELDEAMRTTSLTHVTAVSGGHFAIIVACVAALCVALRASRTVRVLVTGAAMAGFVVLVHPEPSVLRAAAMGVVGLTGVLLGRPSRAVAALGAAVVVLLVLDPWLARSYGFVLSVAATAGLALGTAPLARTLAPWCGRTTAHVLAVPVAAQVACAPILVLLEPSVSVYSVPANLVAAPALGPATVLGVVATLLAPVWPAGATGVAALAGVFTGWIAGVAEVFAELPGARLPWPGGVGGLLLLVLVTATGLTVLLRSRGLRRAAERRELLRVRRRPWRSRLRRHLRAVRRTSRPVLLTALVGIVAAVLVVVLVGHRLAVVDDGVPADWAVVACDVGQGDALALRSGPSSAVVVDVGPPGAAADRCLDDLGVDRVDLLVLSHFHADHVGGLDAVLQDRVVERALVTGTRDPVAQADRALGLLEDAGVPVDVARPGDAALAGGADGVRWEVLQAGPAPGGTDRDGTVPDRGQGGGEGATGEEGAANDASVVLLAEAQGIDVVALGDLEDAGQESLVRVLEGRGGIAVDVVKVAHHGSRTQSERLASALSPAVALVSSGENTYGHPTDHAMDLYRGVGSTVLRTDTCGTFALVVRDGVLGSAGCG